MSEARGVVARAQDQSREQGKRKTEPRTHTHPATRRKSGRASLSVCCSLNKRDYRLLHLT
ncbi:Unknown protein sequence [Pseudomonas syringae pv. cilantro]|uniref:Uncharacterized protein n=2 Tax=Pseudomonas syringae group TaxID=136849 RepID=A0A0N0XBW4_PSESX|nr:Unknown protein sequence [Pseudomonas syringae pv. cilantro]KPW79380.1 hypothetical protein ALO76_102070 [Pseudomonas syringae pv. coriandricola]RMN09796.1 hypothetical protein ALQ65_101930 [Pseudomonas syringae pv. coriandricola]